MTNEIVVPFRSKLEEISANVEKCKTERQRRHSEFTKRIEDVIERYDKVMSGRLRRLSLEGIVVDSDSFGRNRREATFHTLREVNSDHMLLDINRPKTVKGLRAVGGKSTPSEMLKLNNSERAKAYEKAPKSPFETRNNQNVSFQLRLELSFDSKDPRPLPKIESRIETSNELKIQRNRTIHNLYSGDKKILRQQKMQRAFAKAVQIQQVATLHRHHTVLPLAPVDIGMKSQLPDITHFDKHWKGYGSPPASLGRLHQRSGSPKGTIDRPSSREFQAASGKQKLQRAMQKLQSVKKFEKLYDPGKKDGV